MTELVYRSITELEAGLDFIRQSPCDSGELQLIVRRPSKGTREVLNEGQLDPAVGLVGDNWRSHAGEQSHEPAPDTQITLMNARAIERLAGSRENWPPAGDQLFVDLDLSDDNLPAGTRLTIGSAVLEVVSEPHTGCRLFQARYGADALKFVNSPEGRKLHLRGIYAKVLQSGVVRVGDIVTKIKPA